MTHSDTSTPPNKNILITGVSGLLGGNLADAFRPNYEVVGLYYTHPVTVPGVDTYAADILNPEHLSLRFQTEKPDVVIHCASLTDVDACEVDPVSAHALNVNGTRHVAAAASEVGAKLIYISTDSVYAGIEGNYAETAAAAPRNVYGRTKLEGESEALHVPGALVLRTNIFGWNIINKTSIGEWVLQHLQNGKSIKGFDDVIFSTIYTYELARVIELAIRCDLSGIFNCCAKDACSKFEFAKKVALAFGFGTDSISADSIDASNLEAARGKKLNMDATLLESRLDYRLPTVDQSVDRFYRDFHNGVPQRIRSWVEKTAKRKPLIQYGRQWIDRNDIKAVYQVMHSDRITQGPKVTEFESAVAEYCGAKHAVAVNSGTSALHIACLAAGLKPGEEVITSPITFVASANCALYCSGIPKFSDIDPETYNMSPELLSRQISPNTRIVIPVHFAGQSCDMDKLRRVVNDAEKKYGHRIFIVEDASHALGSVYKGASVGSCKYSDMAVTSFHPVKHITTGEGGMVLCNNSALYSRLIKLRSHGITSSPSDMNYRDQAFDGDHDVINPWYYEQVELGYNYRITDIQCALGHSQLKRIDDFRQRRREIVEQYNAAFCKLPSLKIPVETDDNYSNFHLYVLRVAFSDIGITRRHMMETLLDNDIQTQVHYIPVHTQPFYRKNFGYRWGKFPEAEAYYQQCLSIPLYPAMSNDDSAHVIDTIKGIIRRLL